jgi:WhiB family transcriptional regulator, redox-sensing transcriptional regulator
MSMVSCRQPPAPSAVVVADAVAATLAEIADSAPVVPAPDWTGALCAQADPDAWHPDSGGHGHDAKRICRRCHLQTECLVWALATNQRHGVWGGLSTPERDRLTRRIKGVAS